MRHRKANNRTKMEKIKRYEKNELDQQRTVPKPKSSELKYSLFHEALHINACIRIPTKLDKKKHLTLWSRSGYMRYKLQIPSYENNPFAFWIRWWCCKYIFCLATSIAFAQPNGYSWGFFFLFLKNSLEFSSRLSWDGIRNINQKKKVQQIGNHTNRTKNIQTNEKKKREKKRREKKKMLSGI